MRDPARDQAEGLRRLLGQEGLRVLRLNSGRRGMGKSGVALNLAAALAGQGREVLVVDENGAPGNLGDSLGLHARCELLRALRGECGMEDAIGKAAGISVLPVAQGLMELARRPPDAWHGLADALAQSCPPVDLVIVDTVASSGSRLLPLAAAGQEEILVVSGTTAGLTDAYAFVKGAGAEYGRRRYRVLMSKVRNEAQARAMFTNLAGAAQRYLGMELELMGMIPHDEKLKRAFGMGRPVLAAFPDAPSAAAFRRLALAVGEWPRGRDNGGDMAGFLRALIRCATSGDASGEVWRAPRPSTRSRTATWPTVSPQACGAI